jgi:hypothetical protein
MLICRSLHILLIPQPANSVIPVSTAARLAAVRMCSPCRSFSPRRKRSRAHAAACGHLDMPSPITAEPVDHSIGGTISAARTPSTSATVTAATLAARAQCWVAAATTHGTRGNVTCDPRGGGVVLLGQVEAEMDDRSCAFERQQVADGHHPP